MTEEEAIKILYFTTFGDDCVADYDFEEAVKVAIAALKKSIESKKRDNKPKKIEDDVCEPFMGLKVDRDSGCWTEEYDKYLETHDENGFRIK